ncbi:MAG TPA: hypothetical protein VH478_23025 [Trebonia sp.]|nr:hypothetical protein [Trebonia sp.]
MAEVEAAIGADGGEEVSRGQYFDPVAVGALIVAIAQFGYQVYTDRRSQGQKPTRESIAQAIRVERRKHSDLTGDETEVIEIVARQIIERSDDE